MVVIGEGELPEMVGESAPIRALLATIRRLTSLSQTSSRPPAVLIEGETGTGKGLVASLLHRQSARARSRFVDVNCAAIPEHLIEAELFGFERSAFTDASRAKPGLFHTAHRGTIFLDEVGLLPEPLQAKLLKVIEERAVRRLGSTQTEPADAWVISATNTDLGAAVAARRFREDLYHRLAVVTLTLPPLRDRVTDIPLLADHFLVRASRDHGLPPLTLTDDARARLAAHPWPGNVRELANTIERSALLGDSPRLTGAMLRFIEPSTPAPTAASARHMQPSRAGSLDDAVKERLAAVLEQTGGNIVRSAALLGIARNTLRSHMRRLGLEITRRAPGTAPSVARTEAPAPSPAPAPPLAPAVVAPRLTVRWERRLVTILRAVLTPSDPEESALEGVRWLELMVDKIQSFGGAVEQVSRVAIDGCFGAEPIEDATRRAGHAAVAMQKELHRLQEDHPGVLRSRMAMHTAHVLVCHIGSTARIGAEERTSMTPVLDSLLANASPGAIVVSRASATLLRHRFALEKAADGEAAEAHRLIGSQPRQFDAPGRRSAFVGRGQEIDTLLQLLASAIAGRGRVAVLRGEAGVGKSRLVWEFTRTRLDPTVRLLEAATGYAKVGPNAPVI
ncbi:MAG TPA: sigma 54-interacting transcriptional regulator, partial [Methylomirabilota bacterium]|nr:sigma 54-interacting transcriptional regulator [Methylomirabilota bacterium]